jgi:hypothetical protein
MNGDSHNEDGTMTNEELKKMKQKDGRIIELTPVKTETKHFNDAEIRDLILHSNQDLLEDYSGENYADAFRMLVLQHSLQESQETGSFPICDSKRADLSMHWNVMVQKRLLVFDHESQIVTNLTSQLFG